MQAEVKAFVEARKQIAELEQSFLDAVTLWREMRDALQAKITEERTKMEALSQRCQEATVSRSVRKSVRVVNEQQGIASLTSAGLGIYVSETINSNFWNSAAKEIAKRGEVHIDGLVIQEKEYHSVRLSDKEERRKVTNRVGGEAMLKDANRYKTRKAGVGAAGAVWI
jgi:nucleotidyltransferase/DNA polymerase involved in DNA repair